jgi:hypothetical protein
LSRKLNDDQRAYGPGVAQPHAGGNRHIGCKSPGEELPMRLRTTLLGLVLSSTAFAQVAGKPPTLAPISLDAVPEQCNAIGKQANTVTVSVAQSARISLASCLADTKLATLALLDCEESVLAVEAAAKPSFEILDGVSATADDVTKIVAEQAKAELYNQMTLRMRKTLGSPGASESDIALYNVRKDLLEGLLLAWKDAAAGSYERIMLSVKAKPALAKNPVVATAMRTAKDRLRLHVASAPPPAAPTPAATEGGAKTDTGEQLR